MYTGRKFLELCNSNKDSRRTVTLAIGYPSLRALNFNLIKTVVKIMQKYGVQETIRFNANFYSSLKVSFDEYALANLLLEPNLRKSWGAEVLCFYKICALPRIKIDAYFDSGDELFVLDKDGQIVRRITY